MAKTLSTALRPYLYAGVKPRHKDVYLRFYSAAKAVSAQQKPLNEDSGRAADSLWSSGSLRKRLAELKAMVKETSNSFMSDLYPRLGQTTAETPAGFRKTTEGLHLNPGDYKVGGKYRVHGKVQRVRNMSRHLSFIDVVMDDVKIQVMVDAGRLERRGGSAVLKFVQQSMMAGDFYEFEGWPSMTSSGELTLLANQLPKMLSPTMHNIPREVTDATTLARFPQLDLMLNQRKRDSLRLRHVIEKTIMAFLDERGMTKVTTPILAADTGGAAAQPFETTTQHIPDTHLSLRIAQELELKKLIAAGMGAVYEIGPCFRNEGLDKTHNPEFTTCEFYVPSRKVDHLISMTERLLQKISVACQDAIRTRLTSLPLQETLHASFGPTLHAFAQLPFLPTLASRIRAVLGHAWLPPILDDHAAPNLLGLFKELQQTDEAKSLKIPDNPTTAKLLDTLGAFFIEPLCDAPTFITEHPAIMSPLAKSFIDPKTLHRVSARAELFIGGIEYANLYEEENDPFAQAIKFLQQSEGTGAVRNEFGVELEHEEIRKRLSPGQQYYIRVLEMGLPPTGGWGCGIDRLVMLFAGADRIADVHPFGNLRNVIAMGTSGVASGEEA